MVDRSMRHDEVDDELHVAAMHGVYEGLKVIERAEVGMHIAVVRYVVAIVALRAGVEWQ